MESPLASTPGTPLFFGRRPLQSPKTPHSAVRFFPEAPIEEEIVWGEVPLLVAPKFDVTPQTASPATPTTSATTSQKVSFFMTPNRIALSTLNTPVTSRDDSPQRTPLPNSGCHCMTPGGPSSRVRETGLQRALRDNCIESVRNVLETNPEALTDSFFDVAFEPPLCFAIRAGVDEEIIDLLLEHGANPLDQDTRGDSPAMVLSYLVQDTTGNELPLSFGFDMGPPLAPLLVAMSGPSFPSASGPGRVHWSLRVARRLVAAGVRAHHADSRGRSLAEVARQRGNSRLAEYWEYGLEWESCGMLRAQLARGCSATGVQQLTPDLLSGVSAYLLPA